jgi:hypothetical protein
MSGRHIRHGWTGALLSDGEMFDEIISLVHRFPHRRQIFVCHGESVTGKAVETLFLNKELDSSERICALHLSAPTIVADGKSARSCSLLGSCLMLSATHHISCIDKQ